MIHANGNDLRAIIGALTLAFMCQACTEGGVDNTASASNGEPVGQAVENGSDIQAKADSTVSPSAPPLAAATSSTDSATLAASAEAPRIISPAAPDWLPSATAAASSPAVDNGTAEPASGAQPGARDPEPMTTASSAESPSEPEPDTTQAAEQASGTDSSATGEPGPGAEAESPPEPAAESTTADTPEPEPASESASAPAPTAEAKAETSDEASSETTGEPPAAASQEPDDSEEILEASSDKDITDPNSGEVIAEESPAESKIAEAPGEEAPAETPAEQEPDNHSFSATVIGPDYPGAQCITLPGSSKGFGSVQKSDWANWVAPLQLKYTGAEHHLEVGSAEGRPYLRQKLVPTSRGSDRVGAGAYLPSRRSYRMSQSVFFEPGFDWGGKNEGGKLGFGFGGGSAASGGQLQTDGYTVRFMWRGNRDGTAHLAIYSYAADRGSKYGQDIKLAGFDVPVGKWIDLAMEVTANSSTGNRDGTLRAWADGELRVQKSNIGWQTSGGQPGIQQLIFSTFYGGADPSWAPGHTTHIRFADVCWAPVGDNNLAQDDFAMQDDPAAADKSVANQPMNDDGLNRAEFSARATINDSLARLDLLMPVQDEALDAALREALYAMNRSMTPAGWLSNDTLSPASTTMTNLEHAVNHLQTVADLGASRYQNADIETVKIDLVGVAIDLTTASIETARSRIVSQPCDAADVAARCEYAADLLQQAEKELASAHSPELYRSQAMAHAAAAWRSAEGAVKSLTR